MPRLYIDGTAISLLNKGVGRYSYELCRRVICKLDSRWEIDIVVYTDNLPSKLKNNSQINLINTSKMSDLFHNLFWLPRLIHDRKYDVLLKPMESTGIQYNVPTITICHDVQEIIDEKAGIHPLPHRMFINYIKRIFKSINLRNSSVIIPNSIFTKEAAAAWYKFDTSKSVVGYCGIDDKFFELSAEFIAKNKTRCFELNDYILTFATGDARENYDLLPEILLHVRKMGFGSKLIVAGVQEDSDYIGKLDIEFKKRNLQLDVDYQFIGFLGEDRINHLIELYTTADFYLELSGHEGFGMQLAEAIACGTTCISSGEGALTEIAAGFDVQFPSFDENIIAYTIVDSYEKNLHQRDNREQVEYVRTHYSWDMVADIVVKNINTLSVK